LRAQKGRPASLVGLHCSNLGAINLNIGTGWRRPDVISLSFSFSSLGVSDHFHWQQGLLSGSCCAFQEVLTTSFICITFRENRLWWYYG
jgi:hypothetical protein